MSTFVDLVKHFKGKYGLEVYLELVRPSPSAPGPRRGLGCVITMDVAILDVSNLSHARRPGDAPQAGDLWRI
jgi:hypothetical protein